MSWRQTLHSHPSLYKWSSWPTVDASELPQTKRKQFIRNLHIVKQVLDGKSLASVALMHSVTRSMISQLLQRCLMLNAEQEFPLTYALIPHYRIKRYERIKNHTTEFTSSGYSGEFSALLGNLPALVELLDEMILARLKNAQSAQVVTPQSFHGRFKYELRHTFEFTNDQYPFNTETVAYESVRKYLKSRRQELSNKLELKKKHQSSIIFSKKTIYAFDEIQIDEQFADAFASFEYYLNDELVPLRLSRVSVIIAKDVGSLAMLGYHIALTRSVNQEDMLSIIDNVLTPHDQLNITTPGLSLLPGAKFPASLDSIRGNTITFGTVRLDNAFSHLAHTVRNYFADELGSTLNFGLPKQPTHRAMIEEAVKLINKVTHSFDSTTGSHIRDEKRESKRNSKKLPVLTLQALDEALGVVLRNYNVTPQPTLGGASPIEVLEKHFACSPINRMPIPYEQRHSPFFSNLICTVKHKRESSKEAYINAMSVKYRGPCLLKLKDSEKQIKIQYDRRDVRKVEVFQLNGRHLGQLNAPKTWQRFKHSESLRAYILKLVRKYRFASDDPLSATFKFLSENKRFPTKALKLVQFMNQYDVLTNIDKTDNKSDRICRQIQTVPQFANKHLNTPFPQSWSTSMSNHRKQ